MLDRREVLKGGLSLAAGTLGWSAVAAPIVGAAVDVDALAEAAIDPWEGGSRDAILQLRLANPEYDLMSRTFLALALGDLAVREPDRWYARAVAALDVMIDDTAAAIADHGPAYFLMPYWAYRDSRGARRSVFVDGEQLLVLAIRQRLDDAPRHRSAVRTLAGHVADAMLAGPVASAESYPDECWTFCNSVALAALKLADAAKDPAVAWSAAARARLVEPSSGMLVSSYRYDGTALDGPEGSSIWLVTHMLRLVDRPLADAQYALARAQLGRSVLGFGWAREWPPGVEGAMDVDSGPVVPVVQASPSSSGLAILAARSAGDDDFADALVASLDLAAFPDERDGRLRFLAGNAVGDAVILAGCTAGPLWNGVLAGEV
jgi:hypothetical protein